MDARGLDEEIVQDAGDLAGIHVEDQVAVLAAGGFAPLVQAVHLVDDAAARGAELPPRRGAAHGGEEDRKSVV